MRNLCCTLQAKPCSKHCSFWFSALTLGWIYSLQAKQSLTAPYVLIRSVIVLEGVCMYMPKMICHKWACIKLLGGGCQVATYLMRTELEWTNCCPNCTHWWNDGCLQNTYTNWSFCRVDKLPCTIGGGRGVKMVAMQGSSLVQEWQEMVRLWKSDVPIWLTMTW